MIEFTHHRVLDSQQAPHLVGQLVGWFQREWGEIDPIEGDSIPRPLVAVDDDGALVGGLAFTSAPKPRGSGMGIWINAVVVSPENRRRGVASRLIQAAEDRAWEQYGLMSLFVFTDVPRLYQRNGWSVIKQDGPSTVLVATRPELK